MYRISYDNERCVQTRPTKEEADALALHHRENGWTDVTVIPPGVAYVPSLRASMNCMHCGELATDEFQIFKGTRWRVGVVCRGCLEGFCATLPQRE